MNKYCVDIDFKVPLLRDPTSLEKYKNSHHNVLIEKEHKRELLHPDLLKIFDDLKLKIWLITIFYKLPDESNAEGGYNIHVDGDPFLDADKQLRDVTKINWVFNPGISVMNWYTPKEGIDRGVSTSVVKTYYLKYTRDEVNLEHTYALNNTHIVQVGMPHDVTNVVEPRLCVSVALSQQNGKRPTMEESIKIFKDYLI
jgi:hypothetical protein